MNLLTSSRRTSGFALGTIIAAMTVAGAARADTGDAAASRTAMGMGSGTHAHMDRDEMRIKGLHDRLMITADQESLWSNVAQIMRSNDETMDKLADERHEKAATRTAVEDLKSYGEVTEAHATGIKNFVPAFESLYQTMSAAQKANADNVFRKGGMGHKMHKKGV